jgi:hypothetical protein
MLWRLLLVFILIATSAFADPSPSIRHLMSEPLSMLEWGIYRIERRAALFAWDDLDIMKQFCDVQYDWDVNWLRLSCTIYPRFQSLQKTPPKQVCGSIISQIRTHFGIGAAPHLETVRKLFGIGTYFRHQFFTQKTVPESLEHDIEVITFIGVRILVSKNDQPRFQEAASCEGDLLSPEIRYITTDQN